MILARLLRRAAAVIGPALPTVVIPLTVVGTAVFRAEPVKAAAFGPAARTGTHVSEAAFTEGGGGVIALLVTVQGQPVWDGDADDPLPQIPAGQPVHVVYEVRNYSLFDVSNLTVSDPVVSGSTVTCPETQVPALGSVDCYATVPAVAGRHFGIVDVSGSQTILVLQYPVYATSGVGYIGLAPPPPPPPPPTPPPPPSRSPTPSMAPPPPSTPAPPPPPHTPGPPPPSPTSPAAADAPALALPNPSPSPSASRSNPPPSRSAPPSPSVFRAVGAPLATTPPRSGVPTPLFVLIMIMPAAAGAAVALSRRLK